MISANLTGPLENQFNGFSDDDCNLEDDDENIYDNQFLNDSGPRKFNHSINSYTYIPDDSPNTTNNN